MHIEHSIPADGFLRAPDSLEQLMTMFILVVGPYSLSPTKLSTCPDRDALPRNR